MTARTLAFITVITVACSKSRPSEDVASAQGSSSAASGTASAQTTKGAAPALGMATAAVVLQFSGKESRSDDAIELEQYLHTVTDPLAPGSQITAVEVEWEQKIEVRGFVVWGKSEGSLTAADERSIEGLGTAYGEKRFSPKGTLVRVGKTWGDINAHLPDDSTLTIKN